MQFTDSEIMKIQPFLQATYYKFPVNLGACLNFNKLSAMEAFRAPTRSAYGVTGVMVMDQ